MMMRGWLLTLLCAVACMILASSRAEAQTHPAPRAARATMQAGAPGLDTSAVFRVRIVRCDHPEPLSVPFGKLARRVVFTLHHGKGSRKVYDSTMGLAWSYRSAVAQGSGPAWSYEGDRTRVMDLVARFKEEEESEIMYAPSWGAHADLAPAGGFGELISLLVRYDDDAGGAHGSSDEHFVTLSAMTGKPLQLSQVLSGSACARIHSAIARALAPGPVDQPTSDRIDQQFAVRRVRDTLRVSIALPYLLDCTDHPATTFHFDLSPRELLPEWRAQK